MKRLFSILFIFVLAMSFMLAIATVSAQDYPDIHVAADVSEIEFGVADKVYINANVYTVDKEFSTASAFAVKDDKFVYVGDDAGAQAWAGSGALTVDLGGRTVIPGLIDSHIHYRIASRELYPRTPDIRAKIGEWASVERMQSVIVNCIATGKGVRIGDDGQPWLVLGGWMSDYWDPPIFHRKLIDAVSGDMPVYISRYTHGSGCNTKALELAGIDEFTPDPEGGHIKKDENGIPTGEFVERAPNQLRDLIPSSPRYTAFETARNDIEGQYLAFAVGLTGINEASGSGYSTVQRRLALYESGIMQMRFNDMCSESAAYELGAPFNYDNKYIVQTVKKLSDGAMGSRGAYLLEDYSDYPDYRGEPRLTAEEVGETATDLLGIGFNMAIHAIGDAANRLVIDGFETALKNTGMDPFEVRFRVEHTQTLSPEDIPRLAPLGLIASMQPLHATEDQWFSPDRLGPERMKGAYIWSTLLDLGVVVASGTDFSVSPYNPFYTLHAAVTRQDRENNPPEGFYPEQAMTREEALWSSTVAGAYSMKMEKILGSIEPGKLADFVVIPVDYMTVPAEDIWKITADMTVIGGEIVYTRPVEIK